MNFYEQLQGLSEEELTQKVKKRIQYLERVSKREHPLGGNLGYHMDDTPKAYSVYNTKFGTAFDLDYSCFYNNYIWKGTKMTYGITYSVNGVGANLGSHYYMDDDSYIYDFCRYIQDKDIENELEFFDYLLEFIRDYFGYIKLIERDEMFQLIQKNETEYFPPVRKHCFTDFKGKGNALCSEYAVMAQNLMRVFGFESYIMLGHEKIGDHRPESHAFNFVTYKSRTTGERVRYLIDFSNYVKIFDIDYSKLGELPFMGKLEKLDQELISEVIDHEKHLTFEDYSYMIIGDTLATISYDRKRDYFLDSYIHPDIDVKKSKTYAYHR